MGKEVSTTPKQQEELDEKGRKSISMCKSESRRRRPIETSVEELREDNSSQLHVGHWG
jgi:hypothetical protein